jgi:hypothetical protein
MRVKPNTMGGVAKMISRWLLVNILTVMVIVFWSLYRGYDSLYILLGKMAAQAAFVLFLININMYFVFLLIRKGKVRKVKVRLAKISKTMMKYHIPLAITASLLILIHGAMMVTAHSSQLGNVKILAGALSLSLLVVLLYSGLLRHRKATGKRRKFHYTMAFIFFGFVILHIFL